MSVPADITDAIASLQVQVAAASPLADASRATVMALQLNANALVENIATAISAPSLLDTYIPPVDSAQIAIGVLNVCTAANDQSALALIGGAVGRAAINLGQLS